VSTTTSSTSRTVTSAPTSADKGMPTCYCHSLLTAWTGHPSPIPDFLWNASPDIIAGFALLTGEYPHCLCTTL
jgi:hypothetical protein